MAQVRETIIFVPFTFIWMFWNPENGRVNSEEWLAYKTQRHDDK